MKKNRTNRFCLGRREETEEVEPLGLELRVEGRQLSSSPTLGEVIELKGLVFESGEKMEEFGVEVGSEVE